MVRPSKPQLMARVLDAVVNLGDTKGSSARDVLDFIRQSNISAKNLTVQVHRALKHAVTAGLLRHRSGRYKVLATLSPVSASVPPVNKDPITNDSKTKEKKLKTDVRTANSDMKSTHPTPERKKGSTSRHRGNTRQSNNVKKRSRRSSSTKRGNTVQNRKRRQRKRKQNEEEFENLSSKRYILHGRDSPVSLNRKKKRSRVSEQEFESDFSDDSDQESHLNRKRISRVNEPLHHRQSRYKQTRAKSKGRSMSRGRTPQMLQRTMPTQQHTIEEIGNDVLQYDEDQGSTEHDVTHQETQGDIEGTCDANDSSSALENS